MVLVNSEIFQEICERKDDIQAYFGVSLHHKPHQDDYTIEVVKERGCNGRPADANIFVTNFVETARDKCDQVPFPSALKPFFASCLGGHIRNILELENKVRLDGLQNENDEKICIYGDEDGRLEVITHIITLTQIMSGDIPPPEGNDGEINAKLDALFKEVKEPHHKKRMFYALNYGIKRKLSEFLKRVNVKRIKEENVRAMNQPQSRMSQEASSSSIPTISLIDDDVDDVPGVQGHILGERIIKDIVENHKDWDIEKAQMEVLELLEESTVSRKPIIYQEAMDRIEKVAGAVPASDNFDTNINQVISTQLIREIQTRHPNWNIERAQMEMIGMIEECNKKREIIDVNDAMRRIELISNEPEPDITLLEDDEPLESIGIDAEVIEQWFLENFDNSQAYNMSVYKSEMFKMFTSHFELYYSGKTHEQHYQTFIEVIHKVLINRKSEYPNVQTKGNTGKNAKKRFAHLRRRGSPSVMPVEIPARTESSIPSWTTLASVVNPRVAPILVEKSFRKVENTKKVYDAQEAYKIKCPWYPHYENLYTGGANGDERCRRIVIDGSNIARSHGKDGEVRRRHREEVFSIIGIKMVVEQFWTMGCRKVTVFLPHSRQGNKGTPRIPEKERKLQEEMEKEDIIKYTPGRYHKGTKQFVQAYDDRYILDMAKHEDGIVLSNDHFRDLYSEFSHVVDWRLLQYVMTADRIMLPTELLPLSRTKKVYLDEYIRFS